MKRFLTILAILVAITALVTSCSTSSPAENSKDSETVQSLTDEEILAMVEPYLEDLVFQDPTSYPSFNDFLKANLNLDDTNVVSATLYLGGPNQNTGCFLMLSPTKDADEEMIAEQLQLKAESMVNTAEQGYTQGYTEYSVIQNEGRFFLVMQADATKYNELVELIKGL